MSPEPATAREVRSGFLLGLGCVIALVMGALTFFGRHQAVDARPRETTRAAGVKTIRTKTGHPVRSSAKLSLDEAGNILPDAPELGPRAMEDLMKAKLAEFQAMAQELECADQSRLLGLNTSAEKAMDEMLKDPRWNQVQRELTALEGGWSEASEEERRVILERFSIVYDQLLAEARRRLSALR